MREISWVAEDLLAYQEGLCSIVSVSSLVTYYSSYFSVFIVFFYQAFMQVF
jgi:hypothetical protein